MDRILIVGGSGLLAVNWAIFARGDFDVWLGLHKRIITISGCNSVIIDSNSSQGIKDVIVNLRPQLVINASGVTSVEQCEANQSLATEINCNLAVRLAQECASASIKFVHISTDHLFSGDSKFTAENAKVSPINAYGQTKAQAEEGVIKKFPEALIIRTNFYGWGPKYRQSFSDVIITSLRAGKAINLFTDVYYTPILAETLINTIHELISLGASGIYNVVGDERISKYDFGQKIASCFNLDSALITPEIITNYRNLVKRPLDMSLSNSKVKIKVNHPLGSVDKHLIRLREHEVLGISNEILEL